MYKQDPVPQVEVSQKNIKKKNRESELTNQYALQRNSALSELSMSNYLISKMTLFY